MDRIRQMQVDALDINHRCGLKILNQEFDIKSI